MSLNSVLLLLFLLLLVIVLNGCVSTQDKQINSAVVDFIKNESKATQYQPVPISEVFLTPCIDPIPPSSNDMLGYQEALRDAVISYYECKDSKDALILKVRKNMENKNDDK